MRRGKRASLFLALPALGIFAIVFAGPVWERIQEELHLRTVARSTGAERTGALRWLIEHGSMRGLALVLEDLLDWDFGRFEDVMTLRLLDGTRLKPAVESELEKSIPTYEDELERVLREGTIPLRAQALGILFKARAPSSVDMQWRAVEELRRACPALEPPLSRIAAAFEPEALRPRLMSDDPDAWTIRAAGAVRLEEALPRLGELSGHDDRDLALAAARSIDDFEGPEAEKELVRCILLWRYDVYRWAGDMLFRKNEGLLLRTLLEERVPRDHRWWQGLMLARLGSAEAVPIIVTEMVVVTDLAEEMFRHLERLAGPEHREIIRSLPEAVRPDQRERAKKVVRSYLERHPGR